MGFTFYLVVIMGLLTTAALVTAAMAGLPWWAVMVPLVIFVFSVYFMLPAHAHEAKAGWTYDHECCAATDCKEIPPNLTPKVTPMGFILSDGVFVGKDAPERRDSKDVRWHRCGEWWKDGEKKVRCLYVPSGGL